MLVRDVLNAKGREVWTTQVDQSLQEALHSLISKKIGALLVLNADQEEAGILTERDILRECHKHPTEWFQLRVQAVMTRTLQTIPPGADLKIVMELMTENRIRHVLVREDRNIVGIVSIGDIVKARLQQTEHEMEHMRNYIHGT